MGLGNVATGVAAVASPIAAHGRAALGYPGADSFMGHQELMGGSLASVRLQLLGDMAADVDRAVRAAGHDIEILHHGQSARLVDGCVLVADNVEARPGLSVNVTASLDDISFDDLTELGIIVRHAVPVPRVIVVGGRGYGVNDISAHMMERSPGQYGVDTPGLGVYDEHYRVRHLGAEVDYDRQLASRARSEGLDVVLLGKAADIVLCDDVVSENIVDTSQVFDAALSHLGSMNEGLVVANVQETDLAGHEQDAERFRSVLEIVDRRLSEVVDAQRPGDVLIVTADHGNDPTIGHSQHTREFVPVLAIGPGIRPVDLGTRRSLADIGATLADVLGIDGVEAGESFLKEIV
jgi:phosphopentomutase